MSAKEMFEKLGYKCRDDREQKGLPLTISYVQLNDYELGGHCPYVDFILPDRKWRSNIVNITANIRLMQAINKQVKELGWLGSEDNEC